VRYVSSSSSAARRSRLRAEMPLVEGSALSIPSFRRRIRSAWPAAVEKKPRWAGSQKREICDSAVVVSGRLPTNFGKFAVSRRERGRV